MASPTDEVIEKCASCGVSTQRPTVYASSKSAQEIYWEGGVDGRPSYGFAGRDACSARERRQNDALVLDQKQRLDVCPRCDHVAPRLDVVYPRIAEAAAARAAFFTLPDHSALARRYLYVAHLFGDEDPREEGWWVLRAAWADEAEGLVDAPRHLRMRAAVLLEDAMLQGRALQAERGGTSVMLAELFRVVGSFARAAEHCQRGLRDRLAKNERIFLHAIGGAIVERARDPFTRSSARDAMMKLESAQHGAIRAAVEALCPAPPPIRLRPRRRFEFENMPIDWSLLEEAIVFARDYLDHDLMIAMLRESGCGVWDGVREHPELLPALLRATDHEEPLVRERAIDALYDKTLPKGARTVHERGFDAGVLSGEATAVDALARRLNDESDVIVRKAGAILRQVIYLDPCCAPRIEAAARAALPKWSRDLSTTGVLERLVESAEYALKTTS